MIEGSVTKRNDGRWQGAVDIPSLNGKRVRKFVYAHSRPECRQKVNALIEEVESGGLYSPSHATFRETAAKWLSIYCINLSPTTLHGYTNAINMHADKYIGDTIISKILPVHIQQMMNQIAKTHTAKTCRNILGAVSGVFKFAVMNRAIKSNPCIGVKISADAEHYKYYIYNEDEYNKLLQVVTGTKDEIPVLLAGLCGLRMSEVMGLTWNDIDFDNHIIHVRRAYVNVDGKVIEKTTKTKNSYREIIAPSYVIERLQLYKGVGLVFPGKDGKAQNGSYYSGHFSRILKNNGLPHTRFHDLRHFNATVMLAHGIPDKEAAQRLGHSDINMTKKYQHVLANMERRPADILDSIVRHSDVKMDVK